MWKLMGYDTFSDEWYSLESFKTEQVALTAAKKRLEKLEKTQRAASSGGQGYYGIQDRVFIESPDGNRRRVLPD